tara:strand:+ start:218 stop:928 length:711 start_codon:yes stop_codon:yes gene_type:complete
MVNIDTVYQKVLTLLNKEQRGYLTPQEYNLMAHKAQMEIFDGYFHDLKTAYQKPVMMKTDINHGDEIELVHKKMYPFKNNTTTTQAIGDVTFSLPPNCYYLDSISVDSTSVEVTELTQKELLYSQSNPLTKATEARFVFTRTGDTITLYPTPTVETIFRIDFWKKPSTPGWGYVVVKGRALYNGSSSASQHFGLHPSEEENLVSRILQLSGVIVQKPGLMEVGTVERANIKQEQNN